jgi:hypothetical protein
MTRDIHQTGAGTPPAYPFPVRPLSDRERYAMAIFNWCRAHPASSAETFLAVIARAETRVATEMVVASAPELRRH